MAINIYCMAMAINTCCMVVAIIICFVVVAINLTTIIGGSVLVAAVLFVFADVPGCSLAFIFLFPFSSYFLACR